MEIYYDMTEKTYKLTEEKRREIFESIGDLETLLDDRIVDLGKMGIGYTQGRHAYIYYRKILWELKYNLRDNLI